MQTKSAAGEPARLKPDTPEHSFALFAIIAAGVVAFLLLARLASGESAHAIDAAIIEAMRAPSGAPVGPDWLAEFMGDATTLGGWPLLTVFTVLIGSFLALRGHWSNTAVLLASVIGQSIIVGLFKDYFERNRPPMDIHLVEATSYSFPSGHSASAAAVYLALAAIMTREVARRRERAFIVISALLIVVLVGATRVYLGVHYPTDVLAGWAFGAAWASLVLLIARRLDRFGREHQR